MADAGSAFHYSASIPPDDPALVDLLEEGEITVLGLMPWSSNGTYLVEVSNRSDHAPAIYKPHSGERPLWDFPDGLWRREVAAYELSAQLGFDLVPPTVARLQAPFGPGSLQAFVDARFEEHYFTFGARAELGPQLRSLAAFDLVANSADRKSGHCLVDSDDRIWAIDNGLCFHVEFKVRTVLWDFAGEPLPDAVVSAVENLVRDGPSEQLAGLISEEEHLALLRRARQLLGTARFPADPSGRRYPWPLV